jgi:hypothetical protein
MSNRTLKITVNLDKDRSLLVPWSHDLNIGEVGYEHFRNRNSLALSHKVIVKQGEIRRVLKDRGKI